MWKVLTVLFLVILAFFGFALTKDYFAKQKPTSNTLDSAISKDMFSTDIIGKLSEFTGDVASGGFQTNTQAIIIDQKDLGEISPFYGKVIIEKEESSADTYSLSEEYLVLRALDTNTEDISITAWSLQSMLTDNHKPILDGVENLNMNTISTTTFITLSPGERAVVSSGESPVGFSFKTNLCTGYLNTTQKFEPELTKNCPSASSLIKPTIDNIRTYGDSCFTFLNALPACQYVESLQEQSARAYKEENSDDWSSASLAYISELDDEDVSPACRDFAHRALTYPSCVSLYKNTPNFWRGSQWRIFLNARRALWKEEREVIRLLDAELKTVDVLSY